MARSPRTPSTRTAPKRMNALRSFLQVNQLEDRITPDDGLWVAFFNGIYGNSQNERINTFAAMLQNNGLPSDQVAVVTALDTTSSFVLQTAFDESELTDQLDDLPGYIFVQEYAGNKDFLLGNGFEEVGNGGSDVISDFNDRRGAFNYEQWLKNGGMPSQDGVVPGSDPNDVLTNNDAGATGTSNFTQSETTVIAFGSTVLVGYNDSGSNASASNKFTGYSRSTDGGTTWVDGGTLPTSAGGDAGDPVLARNDTTGRIYFSTLGFSVSTIQMFRSDDGGATSLAPVNATPGGSSEGKQWHVVDNYPGAGNGNVYLISRSFGAPNGIYMYRSTDNGNTFGPTGGVQIVSGQQGAYVAVAPDHSVYAFWYDSSLGNAAGRIMMRRSTDFGVSFSAPVVVVSGLVGGVNGDLGLTGIRQGLATASGFRSNEFPHVAINPISGHIYVTYNNDGAGTDKGDVFVTLSTNNGATWSAPTKVNDDVTTTDQWQPTIAVTPDGSRLGIFYYSRQEDPVGNNLFKYYGRVATISGATLTFAPSFAVSSVASLPEFGRDSLINSVYMGDYNTAYATAGAFHVVWSDNRFDLPGGAPRKNPDVFYQKIQLGLAVTTTVPAVGSTVAVAPTVFTVNVTDPLAPASVQAADFTVNGIPATSVAYTPGTTTLTFTFAASPVTVQGIQTMAVAAGAFTTVGGDPVLAFSGTFRYDLVALTVISTVPPVGGVFTLPAPFTYDVNFNEPVDPASVSTADLSLSGIAGATVTGVVVLPGNTTARFTLTMPNTEGALTASIAAGAINDSFGNPNPAPFSGVYQVDIGTVPYPVPLLAKNPVGSRVYDPVAAGVINFAGDVDSFTINLDPNQKLSIIVTPTSPGLQPRVELFNAANVSLGFAQAPAAGQVAGFQTFNIAVGGVYRMAVSGAAGTLGGYTIQVILNAAFEFEGLVAGNTNNTLATAQDINPTFRTESTGFASGSIGSVLGTSDSAGYAATAIPFAFEDISATGTIITAISNVDDAATTITPGFSFTFFGTAFTTFGVSSNGLIMFGGTDSTFTNADLTTSPTLAAIAPFWDDLHTAGGLAGSNVFFQITGAGANQHLTIQWNQIRFFSGGSAGDTLTFQAQLFADGRIQFNYQDLVSGAAAGNNGASATVGVKAAGAQGPNRLLLAFNNGPNAFVGTGQSTLITPPNPTPDLYSMTLAAGQRVTVGIAPTTAVSGLTVDLLNAGGVVVASGVAGATNLAQVISNFVVPAAGTYYVRVNAAASAVPYDVVVTKDAAFDTEDNNTAATAQNITGTNGAFGAITPSAIYLATAIPFAFEDISATGTIITGISNVDDSAATITPGFSFTFYGSAFTTFGVSSNGLITFGGTDSTFTNADLTTSPTLAAIAPFWDDLHTAGGLAGSNVFFQITGAGANQHLTIQWNQIRFFSGGSAGDTLTFQAQLFADGRIQFNYLDLVSGAAAGNNGASATVGIKAAGAQGPNRLLLAFNNGPNTFVGTGKSTLISQPSGDDWYAVTMAPGQTALAVATSTPSDGSGEFVNVLNPKVEVYDSTGTILIAVGVPGADGRNESVIVTGLTPGTSYRIKVSAQASTVGEYFVTATALRTPTITSKVDDGLPSTFGPDGSFIVPNPVANGWTNVTGSGYLSDYTLHTDNVNEVANNFAVWNVRVTSTTPELFVTWVARPQNATNATYQIYDGPTLRGTVTVNQQVSPNDAIFAGVLLESLGAFLITNTYATIRLLTLGANGDLVADGAFDPPSGLVFDLPTSGAAPAPARLAGGRGPSVAMDLHGTPVAPSRAAAPARLAAGRPSFEAAAPVLAATRSATPAVTLAPVTGDTPADPWTEFDPIVVG